MDYSYAREASGSSIFRRLIENQAPVLEEELRRRILNYTGTKSRSTAKVEPSPSGLTVRLWIDMRFQEDQTQPRPEEARELAEMFLGKDYALGPHRMVEGMWVAVLTIKL